MLTRRLADRDRDDVFCGAIVDPVAEYGRTARACFGLCRGALVFWMIGMLGGPTHFREGPCLPDGYLNTNYNKQRAIRLLQPLQPTLAPKYKRKLELPSSFLSKQQAKTGSKEQKTTKS